MSIVNEHVWVHLSMNAHCKADLVCGSCALRGHLLLAVLWFELKLKVACHPVQEVIACDSGMVLSMLS